MTPRDLWERYKTLLFDDPALGLRLDLSRAGIADGALAGRETELDTGRFAELELPRVRE
jgi:hypothetical protein